MDIFCILPYPQLITVIAIDENNQMSGFECYFCPLMIAGWRADSPYGITIDSAPDEGTRVNIRMPKLREEEERENEGN